MKDILVLEDLNDFNSNYPCESLCETYCLRLVKCVFSMVHFCENI